MMDRTQAWDAGTSLAAIAAGAALALHWHRTHGKSLGWAALGWIVGGTVAVVAVSIPRYTVFNESFEPTAGAK